MAKRTVVWTKTADLQFVGILQYWTKKNKSSTYSVKLIKLVAERTKEIIKNPLSYKATDYKDIRVATNSLIALFFIVN